MLALSRAYAPVVASGALVASTWLPPRSPLCLCFAFAPMFVAWWRAESVGRVACQGFVAGLVNSTITFFWVAEAVRNMYGLGYAASLFYCVLAATVANSHMLIVGASWKWLLGAIRLPPAAAFALLVLLWLCNDAFIPKALPFHYGYPWLWSELQVRQWADVVGASGLAAVTLGANAWLALRWVDPRRSPARLAGALGGVVLCVATLHFTGEARARHVADGDRRIRLGLFQPNAELRRSPDPASEDSIGAARRLLETSLATAEAADLWIWPEGALQIWFGNPLFQMHAESLRYDIEAAGTPILSGAFTGERSRRPFNSIVAFDARGNTIATYTKRELFPFGEAIPGSRWFPLLRERDRFLRGGGVIDTPVIEIAGTRFGPSVCFESLFPDAVRRSAERGAQVLVNLSSDGRFGRYAEPYQHLYMSLARAIEFRRPLLRVTQTGISAVVAADGRILEAGPLDRPWAKRIDLRYEQAPKPTLFQQHGANLPYLWLALTAALIVAGARLRAAESPGRGVVRPPQVGRA